MKANGHKAVLFVGLAACLVWGYGCLNPVEQNRRQVLSQGKLLYQQHCQNCHGENGEGYGQLYPPLAGADYLSNNQSQISCLIKYGHPGGLIVNGIEYKQPMPANKTLLEDEIAQLTSFVLDTWGESDYPIKTKDEVVKELAECEIP